MSVAIVPLLANILPIAWVYDAEVIVPSCDLNFYRNINMIKNGYVEMYPIIEFKGRINVDNIEENVPQSNCEENKTLVIFQAVLMRSIHYSPISENVRHYLHYGI